MTQDEAQYLIIIHALSLKLHYTIQDTNHFITDLEEAANTKLKALLQKQVEADIRILNCWEQNLEMVLEENAVAQAEIDRLRAKLKVRKKYYENLD